MSSTRFLALLVLLSAAVSGVARAGWAPQGERRAQMAALVKKHGMKLAAPDTVQAFNRRFQTTLPQGNVAIAHWEEFKPFAVEAAPHLLGAAWVNHGGGPHGILVVGDRARDSIEETFDRQYSGGGKTRDRWLAGEFKEGGLVLALWHAPTEDLTAVGTRSEQWLNWHRGCGHHCVHFVHDPLAESSAHFTGLPTMEYPTQGAEALLRRDPDLVLQVVHKETWGHKPYEEITGNPGHHIEVWSQQGTEPPKPPAPAQIELSREPGE